MRWIHILMKAAPLGALAWSLMMVSSCSRKHAQPLATELVADNGAAVTDGGLGSTPHDGALLRQHSQTAAKPAKPLPVLNSQMQHCLKFVEKDEQWRCLPLPGKDSFIALRDRLSFRMPCEHHRSATDREMDWQTTDIHYLTLVTPTDETIPGYEPKTDVSLEKPQFKELPFYSKGRCNGEQESQLPIAAADLDGDGNLELFSEHKNRPNCDCQGDHSVYIEIWTLRGDAVERYPQDPHLTEKASGAAHETAWDEIEDLDNDGRPDFVHRRGPYAEFNLNFNDTTGTDLYDIRVKPIFALHAQTDGSYVWDDAVTRSFVKMSCPQPVAKQELSAVTEAIRLADKLICARVWGMSIADAKEGATKACAKRWIELMAAVRKASSQRAQLLEDEALAASSSECLKWVSDLIEISPPTHLRAALP